MRFNVQPLGACKAYTMCWVEFIDASEATWKLLNHRGLFLGQKIYIIERFSDGQIRFRNGISNIYEVGPITAQKVLVRIEDENGRWSIKEDK